MKKRTGRSVEQGSLLPLRDGSIDLVTRATRVCHFYAVSETPKNGIIGHDTKLVSNEIAPFGEASNPALALCRRLILNEKFLRPESHP